MTHASRHHASRHTAWLSLLAEIPLSILFVVAGVLLDHHLDFLPPPPLPLPLGAGPEGGNLEMGDVQWRGFALLLVVVIYVAILRTAHIYAWFHRRMLIVMAAMTVIAVAIALWYILHLNRQTCEYEGYRYIIGTEYADPKLEEKYRERYHEAIVEHPNNLEAVWTQSSITAAQVRLGIHYLLAVIFLAASLILAGEILYEHVRSVVTGTTTHDDTSDSATEKKPIQTHTTTPDTAAP